MCDYNKIFKDIAQYRIMKAQAEAELERLENEIKEYMTAEGITELIGDEHKAKYQQVVTSRVNTTALKKEMPEIAAKYLTTNTTMRFNFS